MERDSSLQQPPFRMTEKGRRSVSVILSAAKNLFPQTPAKVVMQRSPGKEAVYVLDLGAQAKS